MAQGGALSFDAARTFVRTLKLGSAKEWEEYSKSGKRPSNIPSHPDRTYRDAGWVSMPDWLGYGIGKQRKTMTKGGFLSFEAARTFVRTLKLGSTKEWEEYSKSGKRPSNIPSNPHKMYRDAGWVSLPDWLGSAMHTNGPDTGDTQWHTRGKNNTHLHHHALAMQAAVLAMPVKEEGSTGAEGGGGVNAWGNWWGAWAGGWGKGAGGGHTEVKTEGEEGGVKMEGGGKQKAVGGKHQRSSRSAGGGVGGCGSMSGGDQSKRQRTEQGEKEDGLVMVGVTMTLDERQEAAENSGSVVVIDDDSEKERVKRRCVIC
jgi:hypothetical protein